MFSAFRLSSPAPEVLCGITVIRRKKASIVASSNPAARVMDETQNAYGDGPCLAAMRDLVTVHVPDLLHETRWPAYITAVAELQGLRSILAVPLQVDGQTRAA